MKSGVSRSLTMRLSLKHHLRTLSLIVLALFAVVLALASQESVPTKPTKAQEDAIERGRGEFADNCAVCHGDDATGGRGPDLMHAKSVRHDKNGDLLSPILKTGIPDKGMPSLGLTDEQIADLVAFLHAQTEAFDQHASASGTCPDTPPAGPGNPEAGKAYFQSKCSNCHSAAGDLQGIASKYDAADLWAHIVCPQGKAPAATVTLATGEKISGTLIQSDDSNIGVRDAAGRDHTWPKNAVKVAPQDPGEAHRQALSGHSGADVDNLLAFLETLK
jgi:cytochrome c oxidase cbb3-type subunit III